MSGDAAERGPPDRLPPVAPDVIAFPPVIFAAFFATGYLTDLAFPVPAAPAGARIAAGAVLISVAVALVLWAGSRFLRARTHIDVRKPATALVTDGPYRLSRNPMYLAAVLLYAGVAILASLPWTLLMLVPCIAVVQIGVIRREERYLADRFGERYAAYGRRVRRWL